VKKKGGDTMDKNYPSSFMPSERVESSISGNLAKAMLQIVKDDQGWRGGFTSVEFMFNPETVTVEKSTEFKEHPTQGSNAGEKEWTHGVSRTLKVSSVYFDTFESKQNVREAYISKMERLVQMDDALHRPPRVLFVWGSFMKENDDYNAVSWYVRRINVEYVMFLNDGTPVRAKVDLDLVEATTIKEQQMGGGPQSPDHAKVYTVQRGDTLQHIAYKEYDDPSEWRRIAEANNIDDPLNLEPGTKLLVPPILK
jgi:hypothetical protein